MFTGSWYLRSFQPAARDAVPLTQYKMFLVKPLEECRVYAKIGSTLISEMCTLCRNKLQSRIKIKAAYHTVLSSYVLRYIGAYPRNYSFFLEKLISLDTQELVRRYLGLRPGRKSCFYPYNL